MLAPQMPLEQAVDNLKIYTKQSAHLLAVVTIFLERYLTYPELITILRIQTHLHYTVPLSC